MIALAIDKASWLDIFKGKFSYYQSCPIGFAIINKIINIYTGYSQYALYIIPTILGISILEQFNFEMLKKHVIVQP